MLGAPGAGKGTQAKGLAKHYNIAHISTGDILREHIRGNTEIGQSVSEILKSGGLVPDELVNKMVFERLQQADCANGFILDGFPRTLQQAKELSSMTSELNIPIDRAILVDVADDTIIERMSGRLSCPKCGAMFHVKYLIPKTEGKCDACSETLTQREDDKKETVINRLAVYHEITEPIIDFYEENGILTKVSGIGSVEEITNSILKNLGENI